MQNNHVPSMRSKSNRNHCPSTASVAASTHTSLTVIPVENKQSGITTDELSKKLADFHHQQQQTASLTSPPTSLNPGVTPDPGPPSTKKPSDDHICAEYKLGKCPHGVSGRTLHQGETWKKSHPKRCRKFKRFGNDPSKGCTLVSACHLYHPQHCKNSVQNQQCLNEKCTLVHMVGTIRVKPSEENRKKSGKYPSQRKSRPDRGSYRRAESTVASDKPQNKIEYSQLSNSFLEIQTLLKLMQADFQSEITSLKQQIAGQETKFSSLLPTANHTLYQQMLPYPLPTVSQIPHLPPALQHLNPTQDPQWVRFHQHSC